MLYRGTLGGMYSGSVNGLVAAHCSGSSYFRARTVPTNPNSTRQQFIRSAVNQARSAWANLSNNQRDQWAGYGAAIRRPNRIGASFSRPGFNEYIRWATPRIFANSIFGSGIEDEVCEPTGPEAGLITLPVLSIVGDTIETAFDTTEPWWASGENALMIWFSAARASSDPPQFRILSPTINYFRGPWRLALVVLGGETAGVITLPDAPSPGDSVRWKAHLSTLNNGYSMEYQGSAVAS